MRKAERANKTVDLHEVGSEHFRKTPLAGAALNLHLQQTFARVQPTKRPSGRVEIISEDMWDGVRVAPNPRFALQPVDLRAVGIGGHRAVEQIAGKQRYEYD